MRTELLGFEITIKKIKRGITKPVFRNTHTVPKRGTIEFFVEYFKCLVKQNKIQHFEIRELGTYVKMDIVLFNYVPIEQTNRVKQEIERTLKQNKPYSTDIRISYNY